MSIQPVKVRQERRSDRSLREAIDRIKSCGKPSADVNALYGRILREAVQLCDAEYGLIASTTASEGSHHITPKYCVGRQSTDEALSNLPTPPAIIPAPPFAKLLDTKNALIYHNTNIIDHVRVVFNLSEHGCEPPSDTRTPPPRTNQPTQTFSTAGIIPLDDKSTSQLVILVLSKGERATESLIARIRALTLHARCALRAQSSPVPGSVAARFLANRQLINLIRASMHGIVTVDDQCNITLINPCAERQFRVHARDTLGSHLAKLIPEITLEHLDKHLTPDPTGKLSPLSSTRLSTAKTTKFTGRRGDSTLFPIEAVVFDTTANNVRYLTLLIEDVSKKVQLQTQHEENLTRLRILSDLAPVGILQVNTEWQCVYANDQWMCLSGLNRQETMGPNWVNAISPFEAEPVLNNLSQCLLRQTDYQHQLCLVSPLGQRRWVQMTARGLYDHSGQNLTGFLATFSDISEQRLAQEKLRTLAESDALTGLVNRAYLTQQVHTLLSATTESTQIALLYIDLDGFKQVNDSYGHAAGDKLLKVVAHRLCQAVRDTDMVARLGGDEFAILLDNLPNAATADKIADKILHTLSQPIQIAKDVEIYVGASIGITLTNPGDIHADRLLMQADIAMYHAKTSGKNKSCVYSAALGTQIARKMELRNQLHRAVEQEDLSVYFQPQIKLSTGTIWGFEALLRWRDSKGNHVPPSEFVPILEETGLVRSVGIWVIQQATTTLMHWRNLGLVSKDTTISVNVSAIQLHDRSFVDGVAQALAISKLPPAALVIEITETALVQGTLSQEILHALRALGVKISLDDFGTGYSSLSYITRLPLDHLKIDRSFIARNPSDTHGVHVTQAIISMAKGLGLTVVAEGVDSFERLTMLKTTNCDIYQGFYFSQAITRDEIQSQLNATRDEMQSPPNQINPDAGQKAPASGSWTCHSLVDNT